MATRTAASAEGASAPAQVDSPVPVRQYRRARRGQTAIACAAPPDSIVGQGKPKTYDWKRLFVSKYKETLSIAASCKFAGVVRETYRDAMSRDAKFREDVDDIYADLTGALKVHAFKRATGNDAPAASVLMFLLRAHEPETYAEKKAGVAVIGTLNVTMIEKITAWAIAAPPVTLEMEASLTPVPAVA